MRQTFDGARRAKREAVRTKDLAPDACVRGVGTRTSARAEVPPRLIAARGTVICSSEAEATGERPVEVGR
jgi:hypothetical protein